MNCPFCGKEMENGYIPTSAYSHLWLPEAVSLSHKPMDTDKLKSLNGLVIKGFTPGFKGRKIDAFFCRSCEKGIFSFDKDASMLI